MKSVRCLNVPGFNRGEVKSFSDNRAITFCTNGSAEPVGWSLDKHVDNRSAPRARNRMLDTRAPIPEDTSDVE